MEWSHYKNSQVLIRKNCPNSFCTSIHGWQNFTEEIICYSMIKKANVIPIKKHLFFTGVPWCKQKGDFGSEMLSGRKKYTTFFYFTHNLIISHGGNLERVLVNKINKA